MRRQLSGLSDLPLSHPINWASSQCWTSLCRGVASTVVSRILADAAAQGFRNVCLQTGKGDGADALYGRMGFRERYTLAKYGPKA